LHNHPPTLDAVPVSTRVNAARNDGPDLIIPVDLDEAEAADNPPPPDDEQATLF